ncbi:FtsK/SpoIIIE domain-containing protein [Janibacter alkaliphilus]|uniref:S-DNA-T family DNA segregation ATPase FtsK/SpoIIIE n=1 Tax=Janibacter alkaliphilus TaxID=1069963 RepID=A0A852X701_9MICO|nr:FtsK/SpoIIIE domain-containing protein [Janibacter alkaliphilus]NYG36543.1 S-DNA-T family DNA segregation ATPase FtsK/SpoIIIE [Janibacter alkaliphilus]
MKLMFTLRGSNDKESDLVATVDGRTTVGDLAEHLVRSDPERQKNGGYLERDDLGEHTLTLVDEGNRAVDPHTTVQESGLRSGVHLGLTRRSSGYQDSGAPVATATVIAGPDTGREFPLQRGTAHVGRGRSCEVGVNDASVSRRHAKLLVADVVEVTDLGSSNGVVVGEERVDRAILREGDTFTVGDSTFEISTQTKAAGVTAGPSGDVSFSRSPRIAPIYQGLTFEVPDLPERGKPQRIPLAMMLVPVFMGATLFAITRSRFTIMFMLMMPMMMLANAWESKRRVRLDFEEAMEDFREDVAYLVEDIEVELDREHDVRRQEHPAVAELSQAVARHHPLMWTRRPGEPGFLEYRLGLGVRPSRSEIKLPKMGRSRAEAWLEVSKLMQGLGVVADVPVTGLPLLDGAVGVAGQREAALGLARSLVVQTISAHSPAEVMVCALASTSSARDWDWLKWAPHTSSPQSPLDVQHTASSGPGCSAIMEQLEDLLAKGSERDAPTGPAIVVLIENDAPVDRARLVQLAEHGWKQRVVVIWVAPVVEQLPAACRTFVEVAEDGTCKVGWVGPAQVAAEVQADLLPLEHAVEVARRLSPIVDSGALNEDDSDIPRAVSFLALTGPEIASSQMAVIERWNENRSILTGPHAPGTPNRKPGTLRAVLGQSALGTYSVDLRSDGPHALVGGTTGAGKSELLQAWILGMATAHSPQRVTFLLVDYKGGSAFRDCVNLPHTVGMVTDLSQHLVRRALASLSAELHYREHLLARFKAKDLVELERRGEVEAPPSLIIIVDEFAALVQEVPDFVDGVVNIAQRGRSLGIHLILATQRPAGVIKDNLRANTNLRMALRMADTDDSTDVLGTAEAAYFDPGLPGRAMAKSGPGRLVPFQTGYAGGWTSDTPPPPDMLVETLSFGAPVRWELPAAPSVDDDEDLGPTDIQRVVESVERARETADIPIPRKPWLPELEDVYDLAALPTDRRDDELVLGVADNPDLQAQPTISFRPDAEGNLAVYGASGSGKSAFLRTIATAAGFTVRGGPCHVYGLDFGNRGLSMLEELPHVGSIISGQDEERVKRLLTRLREIIDERAVRYSRANATTITAYRKLSGNRDEPRIFVLVDGLTAFRSAYESTGALMRWLDAFTALLGDGRPVGVHFVLSVDARNGLPVAMGSSVQSRFVLRMATEDDYAFLGVPTDVLSGDSPPGRGIFKKREVQVAVLGGTQDASEQSRMLHGFAEAMGRSGASPAAEIAALPEKVPAQSLPAEVGGLPVVAMNSDELAPVALDPKGGFVVTGPPGSGRTTAVAGMVRAIKRWKSDAHCYLITLRRSSELLDMPEFEATATREEAIKELCVELKAKAEDETSGMIVLVLEKVDDLAVAPHQTPLQDAVKPLVDNDHVVIGEADPQALTTSMGLQGLLKSSRSGIALAPDGSEASMIFKTTFPPLARVQMPEGRGVLVRRGKAEIVQVALPEEVRA